MDIIAKIIIIFILLLIIILPLMLMWWIGRRVYGWGMGYRAGNVQSNQNIVKVQYYEAVVWCVFLSISILMNSYDIFLWEWPTTAMDFENEMVINAAQCGMKEQAIERINIWRNSSLISFVGLLFLLLQSHFRVQENLKVMTIENRGRFSLQLPAITAPLLYAVYHGIRSELNADGLCNSQYYKVIDIIFLSITPSVIIALFFLSLIWGIAYYVHNYSRA
ncbi:hypothetical protein [Paremcibacter congregatus]|uniref:hypothetical protein n=1 Tax=Paremcibacter congregatus TaxID=2043170 RepID=UPI003A8E395A